VATDNKEDQNTSGLATLRKTCQHINALILIRTRETGLYVRNKWWTGLWCIQLQNVSVRRRR